VEEFNAAASAYTRRVCVIRVAIVLTLTVCLVVGAVFQNIVRGLLIRLFPEPAAEIIMGLAPTPALIVLFGGLLANEQFSKRDPQLKCPSCGKVLVALRHLVVATRHCGYSGRKVLDVPDEGI
jgi:hypothetical protein